MKYTRIFLSLIAAFALIVPARAVFATSVSNTVSASARTGGNTTAVQNVKAGLSKASVSIKTMIEGVVVEDIERYEEGSAVEIHEESSHVSGGKGTVASKTETRAMPGEQVDTHGSEAPPVKISDVKITHDIKDATTTVSTSTTH